MERVTEYDIIMGKDVHDLQRRVAEALGKGWTPIGGLAFNANGHPTQAVVQYEFPRIPSTGAR